MVRFRRSGRAPGALASAPVWAGCAVLLGIGAAGRQVAFSPAGWRAAPRPAVAAASARVSARVNPAVQLPTFPRLGGQRPTFILFQSRASSLERAFLADLQRNGPARDRKDLRVVRLNGLDTPEARRFGIHETPTLLALGSGGKEISRHVGPQEITASLSASQPDRLSAGTAPPAATCHVWRGPRLRWVEESDPRARRVYRRFGGGRWAVPDIFKAMSLRPDLMEKAFDLSESGHFSDGYLSRKTKERIATYVSSLDGSHYCTGSHAGNLKEMGARSAEVAALARGDLDGARLSMRERALLAFARRLTLQPGDIGDADIARLRAQGWRDEQIFEAAFDASLFAFFNRVAVTYGLDYPPDAASTGFGRAPAWCERCHCGGKWFRRSGVRAFRRSGSAGTGPPLTLPNPNA